MSFVRSATKKLKFSYIVKMETLIYSKNIPTLENKKLIKEIGQVGLMEEAREWLLDSLVILLHELNMRTIT